jgi:hypothetical protein
MMQDLAQTVPEMEKYMTFSVVTQWTDGGSLNLLR